jgi:hypothetical protein
MFVRAAERLGNLDGDIRRFERSPQYFRPPWTESDLSRIDYELCAIRRSTINERCQLKVRTSQQNIHRWIEKRRKGGICSSAERKHNKKKTISTKLDLQC